MGKIQPWEGGVLVEGKTQNCWYLSSCFYLFILIYEERL